MLAPWLELDGVSEQVATFSELSGLDLARLGTTADADEIRDSAVTQPLIVAMGLITASQLQLGAMSEDRSERQRARTGAIGSTASEDRSERQRARTGAIGTTVTEDVVLAGHSVGEVTASAIAGVLTPEQAISFSARRGSEMAAACAAVPTSMVALLGGDPEEVVAAIQNAGLTPANRNGAGQIVAAGSLEAIAALTANPPAGTRIRPLRVAGAFHTSYMSPAEQNLRTVAAQLTPADPTATLLSNADGAVISDGPAVLDRLVGQVTRPVRWDLCLDTLRDLGVTGAIELAPAGALTGIARREFTGVRLVAVKSPADLEAARHLLADSAAPGPDAQATPSSSGQPVAQLATGMS
ncbi:MAG TPA: ACP S-malonyltransferase [Jatrophihabitans sp.]|nr:ACP S-malonyltransferase [Jatrophihabitans sp.]